MNEKIKIPDSWRWVKLGEVVKIVGGDSAPQDSKYFEKGNIPFVRMQDLGRYHQTYNLTETIDKVNQNAVKELKMTIFPSKVILIPRSGSVYKNHRAILGCNACVVSHIAVLNSFKNIDPFFLYFYLCIFDMKNIASKTTGLDVISFKDLTQVLVPLPPIEDQKRIASKIQELMQEIDIARNACEKQLEAAKSLPSAYLRQVFESEEAKKWERKRLGEVCKISSGSSAPQEKKYFENGKYPFVRVQDLGKYGRTTNLIEIKDYVNDTAIKELNMVKAEKGTILFPKSGAAIMTNNRAILGIDAYIVSHLAALNALKDIADNYFIYHFLCLIDMVKYMENPGYPSLKLSTISKILIPLPPLEEQKRIASKIQELMQEVEHARNACEKQLDFINSLPQTILKKAFKGEL